MRRLMPSKSTTSFFLSSILVVPWRSLALVGPRMGRLAPARRANPGPPRRDRFPSWGFDSSDSHFFRHARYESGWALHAPLSGMRPGLRRAPSWPEGGSAGHANPFESQNRLGRNRGKPYEPNAG